MELTTLLSPLVLSVSLIGVVFFFILWRLDSRRHRHHRLLRRLMNQYIRDHSAKRFSLIVELDRSATALWPLLEHLSSINYQKLQVIVLVRHTAGKRALSAVRNYQQSTQTPYALSVVKHRQGLNRTKLTKRYATGELIMWLSYRERVSENFFQRISIEFLDSSLDAVAPRRTLQLRDSLSSAATAWHCIASSLINTIQNIPDSPVVYRRSALLDDALRTTRNVDSAALMTPINHNDSEWRLSLFYFLPAVVFSGIASVLLPFSWQLVAVAAYGGTVLLLILHLFPSSYRLTEKLSLVLFLPFWPFVAVGMALGQSIHRRRVQRFKQKVSTRSAV